MIKVSSVLTEELRHYETLSQRPDGSTLTYSCVRAWNGPVRSVSHEGCDKAEDDGDRRP